MSGFSGKIIFASCLFFAVASLWAEKISVHEFTVFPEMERQGLTGWWAAEQMESLLSRTDRFEVITRARIAQVLREQNLDSGAVVRNEPARIEKADLVLSGRFVSSGQYTTLTVSVIRTDSAAISRSFQLSCANVENMEAETAQRLLEDAAAFLVMSPGAMFAAALECRAAGEFRRTREIMTYLMLNYPLAELDEKELPEAPELSGKSIAELFDSGVAFLEKGAGEKAEICFGACRRRAGLNRFSDLRKEVEQALDEHDRQFEELLDSSRKAYQAVLQKGKGDEAVSACENEIRRLRDYIRHTQVKLLQNELQVLEAEISRFQEYRNKIFAGPSEAAPWVLPELEIRIVPIPAGEYTQNCHEEYGVPRKVRITHPFWIAEKEISVGEYVMFLNSVTLGLSKSERYRYDREIRYQDSRCPIDQTFNLRRGFRPDDPMSCISWRGAKLYADWVNERERKEGRIPPGYEYRLPTEGEWDWAARGGASGEGACLYCTGAGMKKIAVTREESNEQARRVGSLEPNAFGLYDMYGNVWEWCGDWYSELDSDAPVIDPLGPDNNPDDCKVVRGGSFLSSGNSLNCGTRREADYRTGQSNIGFRIVCGPVL